jgi:hypothetical protein
MEGFYYGEKKPRKQRLKKYRHREMKKQRERQQKTLLNGETLRNTLRIEMPSANQYTEVFNDGTFQEKIDRLYSIDIKEAHIDTLRMAINDVFSYKPDPTASHSVVSMMSGWRQINKNGNLFRVRLSGNDFIKTMIKESDAWNPPIEYVKQGRLNFNNESLLYVAEDMETAIKEMKLKNEQGFWLIVYDIKNDLKVVTIAEQSTERSEFTTIHNKINGFLRKEFTRDVVPGNEYEYKVSAIIAKFYYPYGLNNTIGWSYPSVADVGLSSICLEPNQAKEKLSVKYVIHYTMKENEIIPSHIGELNNQGLFEHINIEQE